MDERIRMECENREEFLRRETTTVKLKVMAEAKLDQVIAKLNQTVAKLDQVTAERNKYLQLLPLHGIDVNSQ